jgi:hypothetical protein
MQLFVFQIMIEIDASSLEHKCHANYRIGCDRLATRIWE